MEEGGFFLREAKEEDLAGLLELYTQLHSNPMPEFTRDLRALWSHILAAPGHHVLVGSLGRRIVSSCVLLVVPNLTHGQRPYVLIENVVTDAACRSRGYATALLARAGEMARAENCYKVMLMTGSKEESTLRFYERAGYNRADKTAFVQWFV